MRISDCKSRTEAEDGLRSDFADRVKVMSKKSSDQFLSHFGKQLELLKEIVAKLTRVGEAGGPTCGAAEEVRAHYQSENRQADRPDDPAEGAGKSGQSHQVRRDECQVSRDEWIEIRKT
jgi:hypothetical protein